MHFTSSYSLDVAHESILGWIWAVLKGRVRSNEAMDVKDERRDTLEDLSDLVLLRIDVVSELCAVSRSRIYELIAAGDLPSIKIGASRRVVASQLREWIARQSRK